MKAPNRPIGTWCCGREVAVVHVAAGVAARMELVGEATRRALIGGWVMTRHAVHFVRHDLPMEVDGRRLGQLVVQGDPYPVPDLGAQLRTRDGAVVGVRLQDHARLGLPLDDRCSEIPLLGAVGRDLGLQDLVAPALRFGRELRGASGIRIPELLRSERGGRAGRRGSPAGDHHVAAHAPVGVAGYRADEAQPRGRNRDFAGFSAVRCSLHLRPAPRR